MMQANPDGGGFGVSAPDSSRFPPGKITQADFSGDLARGLALVGVLAFGVLFWAVVAWAVVKIF